VSGDQGKRSTRTISAFRRLNLLLQRTSRRDWSTTQPREKDARDGFLLDLDDRHAHHARNHTIIASDRRIAASAAARPDLAMPQHARCALLSSLARAPTAPNVSCYLRRTITILRARAREEKTLGTGHPFLQVAAAAVKSPRPGFSRDGDSCASKSDTNSCRTRAR
jgi:hypothetical protein